MTSRPQRRGTAKKGGVALADGPDDTADLVDEDAGEPEGDEAPCEARLKLSLVSGLAGSGAEELKLRRLGYLTVDGNKLQRAQVTTGDVLALCAPTHVTACRQREQRRA